MNIICTQYCTITLSFTPKLLVCLIGILSHPKQHVQTSNTVLYIVYNSVQFNTVRCNVRILSRHYEVLISQAERQLGISNEAVVKTMPRFRYIYFDIKGRGELVRLVFVAAGVQFEDVRISWSQWPALKPSALPGPGHLTGWSRGFFRCAISMPSSCTYAGCSARSDAVWSCAGAGAF